MDPAVQAILVVAAEALVLSNHTVKSHVNRIFAKTRSRDRAAATQTSALTPALRRYGRGARPSSSPRPESAPRAGPGRPFRAARSPRCPCRRRAPP